MHLANNKPTGCYQWNITFIKTKNKGCYQWIGIARAMQAAEGEMNVNIKQSVTTPTYEMLWTDSNLTSLSIKYMSHFSAH